MSCHPPQGPPGAAGAEGRQGEKGAKVTKSIHALHSRAVPAPTPTHCNHIVPILEVKAQKHRSHFHYGLDGNLWTQPI